MDPKQLFADERFSGFCVFCGAEPNTRDHIPSRVLLEEPYPANLSVVEACAKCNAGFSLDEAYVACVLDCVIAGSTEPEKIGRPKIRRMLQEETKLKARIAACAKQAEDGGLLWDVEMDRVRNVVLKLARGHAAYELSLPQLDEPQAVELMPLVVMSERERSDFEEPPRRRHQCWPEIGSRAFIRACKGAVDVNAGAWITVQPGRYRFMIDQTDGLRVQIVLSEYLACRVCWD